MRFKPVIGFITVSLLLYSPLSAQQEESIHWLSFEELEDSLSANPKKVFIDFYTNWCTYCRKMDRVVFTKPKVIELVNKEYYSVRFNAETDSVIAFGGHVFVNDQVGKSRTPIHQIAQLLATSDGEFIPPAMIILDEEFRVTARYFEYLDSKKLLEALD
ncbi:MAG: thioredoxin family protein [Bacteroidota bacterium]